MKIIFFTALNEGRVGFASFDNGRFGVVLIKDNAIWSMSKVEISISGKYGPSIEIKLEGPVADLPTHHDPSDFTEVERFHLGGADSFHGSADGYVRRQGDRLVFSVGGEEENLFAKEDDDRLFKPVGEEDEYSLRLGADGKLILEDIQ